MWVKIDFLVYYVIIVKFAMYVNVGATTYGHQKKEKTNREDVY